MELSNSLPTGIAGLALSPRLCLNLLDGILRLSLQVEGSNSLATSFAFSSPLRKEDAFDARWLLEDHPRLRGRSVDPIAARIEERLHELSHELRTSVFEANADARRIGDALADPEFRGNLSVSIQEPALARWIPWELMLAPDSSEPLSVLAASFSRSSPSSALDERTRVERVAKTAKLRVLLITSRPNAEADVPFRSVASRIVQAVAASPETDVEIDLLRPPTYLTFQTVLAAAAKSGTPYDVVHFDGHGSYQAVPFDPASRRCYLAFESNDGSVEYISGDLMGGDLAAAKVRYLLLNACRTAFVEPALADSDPQTTERAFGTFAAEVLAAGVPGVLAMGFNLYVVTAATLVANTYAALAAGCELDEAVGYARRRIYNADPGGRVGAFDWLVPITFQNGATKDQRSERPILDLEVKVSTTTPAGVDVIDSVSDDGPRSDQRPFFGYDGALLRLDRACTAGRLVEVIGLAGVGKSAVVGEFARWWAATTPSIALVQDVDTFDTFADFEAQFKLSAAAVPQTPGGGDLLLVLDGAGNVLDPESQIWSESDRVSFQHWIEQQAGQSRRLVITGRTSCSLDNVATVTLAGLDDESREELAAYVGFDGTASGWTQGLLQWSHGIPIVVSQLPMITEGVSLTDGKAVRKLLFELRSGKTASPQLGMGLIERSGLEFYNTRSLRRAVLPFALSLFQSFVADGQIGMFCQVAAMKGINLTGVGKNSVGDHELEPALTEELRPAIRAGLAGRISDGYLLHPFAPIAIDIGVAATLQAISGGDGNMIAEIMGRLWVSYIQSVLPFVELANQLSAAQAPNAGNRQNENLINAVEISLLGGWWGLLLPLLHKVRDKLIANGRESEWRDILYDVLTRFEQAPPQAAEMGAENASLQIIRLLAEEAERDGDQERLSSLRALQLRVANADDTVLVKDDGKGTEVMDLGMIHRIAALLKNGDLAAGENSADCLTYYDEALRLTEESKDILRVGEVHIALARAYLNVRELYDPAKYEFHARAALAAAKNLGPLGADLNARASLSLGNAILETLRGQKVTDRKRLKEARDALRFAASSADADANTRGSARNGLGNIANIDNDHKTAANEYLAACKEAEASGNTHNLLYFQTSAARALANCGKFEDALDLAQTAILGLQADQAVTPQLMPALAKIIAFCEQKMAEPVSKSEP